MVNHHRSCSLYSSDAETLTNRRDFSQRRFPLPPSALAREFCGPHLLVGGSAKGGLYGAAPQLPDLQEGDLKYQIDYRGLYWTVIKDWWGLRPTIFDSRDYPTLGLLA